MPENNSESTTGLSLLPVLNRIRDISENLEDSIIVQSEIISTSRSLRLNTESQRETEFGNSPQQLFSRLLSTVVAIDTKLLGLGRQTILPVSGSINRGSNISNISRGSNISNISNETSTELSVVPNNRAALTPQHPFGQLMILVKDINSNIMKLLDVAPRREEETDNASSSVSSRVNRQDSDNNFFDSITGIFTGIIFAAGTVKGFVSELVPALTAMKNQVFSVFTKIGKLFSNIGKFIIRSIPVPTRLTGLFDPIKNMYVAISNAVKLIVTQLKPLVDISREVGGVMSKVTGAINKALAAFSAGSRFGVFIAKLLPLAGGLLKAIALPLTLLTGVVYSVIRAVQGFKTEGIIGAIKGAISGFLEGVVGTTLDLLKSIVSWTAGALGFDKVEAFLDSFSFTKILTDGVDAIVDSIKYIYDSVVNIFSPEKFKNAIANFSVFSISKVLGVVVGGILDMVKGVFSWILGTLGAFDIAAAMDAFSFQHLFDKIFAFGENLISSIGDAISTTVDYISNWVTGIPDKIGEVLSKASERMANFGAEISNIGEMFIQRVLQNILPKRDASTSWYKPSNLAAAAIPDSVYKFAGIDPASGQKIDSQKMTPKIEGIPKDTASTLNKNGGGTGGGTTIINNVTRGGDVTNTSNSNVNNSNGNGASSYIVAGSAMGFYAL